MKGASRRTFRDQIDINIFSFASRLAHLFSLVRVFILHRNILQHIRHRILERKLSNTANGILVNPINIMISNSYDNVVFLVGVTKIKIAGVEQKLLNNLLVEKTDGT